MKKFFLFVFVCLSLNAFAQEDIASVREVNFYGVDFSHANLYGLQESSDAIQSGLERINNLFITEKKKYDISKYLKKEVINYCLTSTDENNANLSVEELFSDNKYVDLDDDQIQQIIDGLSCIDDNCGLVLIAENLNKKDEKATFRVVFFDGKTKEIIYSKKASGKALGFGIRNHWAGSIHGLLKNWKY